MPNNKETQEELVATAQTAWEKLTIRHFVNLAETMPHRVEEVILYEGWHTSFQVVLYENAYFEVLPAEKKVGLSTGVQILMRCDCKCTL